MNKADVYSLLEKAGRLEFLNHEEGLYLYENAELKDLVFSANSIRMKHIPNKKVGWMIDRNVNITNVCISFCKFCNFCRKSGAEDAYITPLKEYEQKIQELFEWGGNQLLLQGGLHPDLGLDFYKRLFADLKEMEPELKLHALGPPEIVHIARLGGFSYKKVLEELVKSGLDSLPGAGAEILVDRVRKVISPAKANSQEWLDVMSVAHQLNLPTSATMMFGHIETLEERILHLIRIRDLHEERPKGHYGFISFIPWPFQATGTWLERKMGVKNQVSEEDYIRLIAISRIMMPNIRNIQSSWLTVGAETAKKTLSAGANDLGSVMIEENVVSAAGASYSMNPQEIQQCIKEAGYIPYQRNQKYEAV